MAERTANQNKGTQFAWIDVYFSAHPFARQARGAFGIRYQSFAVDSSAHTFKLLVLALACVCESNLPPMSKRREYKLGERISSHNCSLHLSRQQTLRRSQANDTKNNTTTLIRLNLILGNQTLRILIPWQPPRQPPRVKLAAKEREVAPQLAYHDC